MTGLVGHVGFVPEDPPPVSETPTAPMKPYRFSVDCCIATGDPESASRLWCSVNDLLEKIPGVFPQGGYFGPMPAEDIIPGSPLADALLGAEQPLAAERTP